MKKTFALTLVLALFVPSFSLVYSAPLADTYYAETDGELFDAEKRLDEIVTKAVKSELSIVQEVLKSNISEPQRRMMIEKRTELENIKSYTDFSSPSNIEESILDLKKQGFNADPDFEKLCREIYSYKVKNQYGDLKEVVRQFNKKAGLAEKKRSIISVKISDSSQAQAYSISYSAWTKLTTSEKLLIASDPKAAILTQAIQKKAYEFTTSKFGSNGLGDKSDGYRHGIWNALMSRDISSYWAEAISTAHEDRPKSELDAKQADGYTGWQHKAMDLNNNKVGRSVIAWYEFSFNCSDATVKSRISTKLTNKSGEITWLHN